MKLIAALVLSLTIIFGHCSIPETEPENTFSQDEIDLMARVVMSEASIEPFDCKQAIAAVILNRYRAGNYGSTIYDVVYSPNQFSTGNNGEPTEECYDAVQAAIDYPNSFPSDMLYFRTGHYFAKYHDYAHIGKTYFSTLINHDNYEEIEDETY